MTKEEAIKKAIYAAKRSPAYEICGYIVEEASGGYGFFKCDNIAIDKMNEFEIDMIDTEAALAFGKIVAVIHSHPNVNQLYHLSAFDRLSQYDNCDGDWILIKPDFTYEVYPAIPRFRGREYVDFTDDCYTIVKDFYAMVGIQLPEFEYPVDWWDKGYNMYLEHLPKNGFTQVDKSDIQPGDLMTFNYASHVPNHAGIYVGDNKVLHHMTNRMSALDDIGRFMIKYNHSVWRHGKAATGLISYVIDRIKGER